jgi:hypothetical protein
MIYKWLSVVLEVQHLSRSSGGSADSHRKCIHWDVAETR